MGEINWDEMLRDLEQREAELDEFCSGMGFDLSDETDAGSSVSGAFVSNAVVSNAVVSDAFPNADSHLKAPTPMASNKLSDPKPAAGEGDGSLILKEAEETLSATDLQVYQIRRQFTDILPDDTLTRMEREAAPVTSQWEDKPAEGASSERMYLEALRLLAGGKLSEEAQEELILLSGSGDEADSGMKQFLSVFTVLQGSPSGNQIRNTLGKANAVPKTGTCTEGVMALADAVLEAKMRQDARNAQQDNRYRTRQSQLDSRQSRAQSEYDAAKRRADRWRQPK